MGLRDLFSSPKTPEGNIPTQPSVDSNTLQATINALDSGLLLLHDNGEVIMSNSAITHLFSLTTAPKKLSDIQNVIGRDYNLQSKFFSSIYQKQPVSDTNIIWEQKYLKITISPVTNVGHLIVITDQTEEKLLDRARDEFFSIASHELRTPLTIIKGNSSMLLDLLTEAKLGENYGKIAQDILFSSDRLITVINNLLKISELEHNKVPLSLKPISLKLVIEEVLTEMADLLKSKDNKTSIITGNEDLMVIADQDAVKQVVSQLITNSCKHTTNGKITITLSKILKYAEISVTDTGQGIPMELQSLLFRKFQQAGESLYARNTEGVGLGLYICKLLVEKMNGKIKLLTSAPGVGTTFSFTLPLAE